MTWINDIESKTFKITTGDKKEYFPLWKLEPKSVAFNLTQNEYPGINGTYIDRRLIKGVTRTLVFVFSGADCHNTTKTFLNSSRDRNPWLIDHPFDGTLTIQPISIKTTPTLNTVTISVDAQETINQIGVTIVDSPVDTVARISDEQNEAAISNISEQPLTFENINQSQNDVKNLEVNFSDIITDQEDSDDFSNLISAAGSATQKLLEDIEAAAQSVTDVNRFIGATNNSIKERLLAMQNTTMALINSINPSSPISTKHYAGFSAFSNITSAANVVVNPGERDYLRKSDISFVRDFVVDYYNSVIDTFDRISGDDGRIGAEQYQLPEAPTRLAYNAVNYALGVLDEIALNAMTEIDILLTEDFDLIRLTHEIYGTLGDNDENIDMLIDINQLGPSQIMILKEGTRIKYLV